MKFADLNLAPAILKAVREQGYDTPTPSQAQAIPAVLAGQQPLDAQLLDRIVGQFDHDSLDQHLLGRELRARELVGTAAMRRRPLRILEHQAVHHRGLDRDGVAQGRVACDTSLLRRGDLVALPQAPGAAKARMSLGLKDWRNEGLKE